MNLSEFPIPSAEVWVKPQPVPVWAHLSMAVYLAVVGTIGCLGNALVLYVFLKYLRRRSQETTFITNMAVSDLLCSVLHFMPVYSSVRHRWAFSKLGCDLYAAGVGLCGLVSILTLACIALERCLVIRRGRSRLCISGPLSRTKSRRFCLGIWIYCILLVTPPFFGWSAYIPEGFMTSCSWDYFSRTAENRSYYLVLFTFGFILPLVVIIVAYMAIIRQVSLHEREMAAVLRSLPCSARAAHSSVSMRILRVVLVLVMLFSAAWLPYAVVTLVGQFGPIGVLSQWVTALPAVFAKCSVVFNPIVYGFAHKHFRRTVRRLILKRPASNDSSLPLAVFFNSVKRLRASDRITSERSTSSVPRQSQLRMSGLRRHMITWNESTGAAMSSASVRHKLGSADLDTAGDQWPRSASFSGQSAAQLPVTSRQPPTNGRQVWLRVTNPTGKAPHCSSFSDGAMHILSARH